MSGKTALDKNFDCWLLHLQHRPWIPLKLYIDIVGSLMLP